MNEIYREIEIKSELGISERVFRSIMKKNENEKDLITHLQKSKLFDTILGIKSADKFSLICTAKTNFKKYGLYANKKDFFGFKFRKTIPNITNNCDSLDAIIKIDFPFFYIDRNIIGYLTEKYHDKKSLKFQYNSILFPFCKKSSFSVVKGYKRNFNYLGFEMILEDFININSRFLDLKLKKVFYQETQLFSNDFFFKLKSNRNSIDRKTLPKGYKHRLDFQHSLFSKNHFYFKYQFKTFLYSFILPRFSNIEFQTDLLITDNERYFTHNLRGFKNNSPFFNSSLFYSLFTGFKFNIYNFEFLERKNINPFSFFSILKENGNQLKTAFGIGLEKKFLASQFEVIYNLNKRDIQLRYIKD